MSFWLFVLLLWATSLDLGLCELTFKDRQLELQTTLDQQVVNVSFPFMNTGKEPVTITSLSSSCDCVTTTMDKTRYLPGEKGTISAKITIKDHVDDQFKSILVKTDQPQEQEIRLTFLVHIPTLATLIPSALFWSTGDKAQCQTILVHFDSKLAKPENVHLSSSLGHFELGLLAKGWSGEDFKITVTPKSTSTPLREEIWVQANLGKYGSKIFKAYAYIK